MEETNYTWAKDFEQFQLNESRLKEVFDQIYKKASKINPDEIKRYSNSTGTPGPFDDEPKSQGIYQQMREGTDLHKEESQKPVIKYVTYDTEYMEKQKKNAPNYPKKAYPKDDYESENLNQNEIEDFMCDIPHNSINRSGKNSKELINNKKESTRPFCTTMDQYDYLREFDNDSNK